MSSEIKSLGNKDINYIQMRLLVSEITPEFEQGLKEKVTERVYGQAV